MKENSQGSLEYLIIIAGVLIVSGLTIYLVTGSAGQQEKSIVMQSCRQATSNCKLNKMADPNASCDFCEEQCTYRNGSEIFNGSIKCCKLGQEDMIYQGSPGCKVAPTADFSYSTSNLTVNTDASGSSDSDGSIVSYEWDWTTDGAYEDTGKTAAHTYSSEGNYDITLRVTDNDNATDTHTKTVSVSEETARCEEEGAICTWYDLNSTRNNLNGDYALMNGLSESTAGYDELVNTSKGWIPIRTFDGSFDGKSHNISDLYINRESTSYVGLFGNTSSGANIINVSLKNFNVTGNAYVGGLVGENSGSVSGCYATGSVNGSGGELGGAGGLVGENKGGDVSDCHASVSIESSSIGAGGLIGSNYGNVSGSYATGSVRTSRSSAGGLLGDNMRGSVSDSYATGSVNGSDLVGGLVGYNFDGNVSDSYAIGSVNGSSDVGGLVGYNFDGSVSDSYAIGSVNGSGDVGGLVGYDSDGSISNSYYNNETSGQDDIGKGKPRTTDDMTWTYSTDTYQGWDFTNVWLNETHGLIPEGEYPALQWQG